MNIENLRPYIGRELKYKELCEILEIKYYTGGKSKIAQLKELETFVKFEKRGIRYMILEIYKEQLEKVDGKAYRNNKYGYDLEITLMYLLQDKKILDTSQTKILELVSLVNENYRTGRRELPQTSKLLDMEPSLLYHFYNKNNKKLIETLESTFKRLRSRALITWTPVMMVCKIEFAKNALGEPIVYKGGVKTTEIHCPATDTETKFILATEKQVLKSLGCSNIQDVIRSGQWDNFKSRVKELILKNGNIHFYYKGYHIVTNESGITEEITKLEYEMSKARLNDTIVEEYKKSNVSEYDKHEWDGNRHVRCQQGYVEKSNKLIDVLIDTSCDLDLKNELEKNRAVKQIRKSTAEQLKIDLDEGVPF